MSRAPATWLAFGVGLGLCYFGDGTTVHFPRSLLITPEWAEALIGWTNRTVATDEWMLCYSSFTDATTPAAFHS